MTEQTELMKTDGTTIAKTNGHDIDMGRMFEKVIDKLSGPGAEQAVVIMERLVAMQLDVNKLEAEQSFNRAFARFQATVPNIPKTKRSGTTRQLMLSWTRSNQHSRTRDLVCRLLMCPRSRKATTVSGASSSM
jgi:hypothetical protein